VQLALATFGKITNTVNKWQRVQITLKLNFWSALPKPGD
jgi:hypothetical protein